MSVPALVIADAVVAALNVAPLSIAVTFERVYVPKFDTTSTDVIQGKVVPKSDSREMGSAADDNATIAIDIGVMKRLQNSLADEKTEMDAILVVCEEIKTALNRKRLASDTAICVGTAQEVIYSVEDIDNGRVFLTAITATFLTTVTA